MKSEETKMMMKYGKIRLFWVVFGIFLLLTSGVAVAKINWEYHKSISGAFDARFPSNYKIRSNPLRVDEHTVIFRVEVVSEVEDDDNPNAPNKVYSIKVDQTTGKGLGKSKVNDLLARDYYKYQKFAKAMGGKIESQKDVDDFGFPGKEFYFTFEKDGVEQGMRIKVMYTDVSRVEAALSGPQSSMYSFRSNDFFDSLKLYDGAATIDGKPGDGWEEYESPLGLFTLVLPEKANTFALGPPRFVSNQMREKGRYTLKDPVLGYKTFFNFFGYKIKQKKNFDDVKTLLFAEHISKYVTNVTRDNLKFDERMAPDDKYGIISTKIRMRGLEKHPYMTAVIIQALFNDDGVVVLEYLGSYPHVESPLGKTLFSLVKFHPEKSYEKENAGADTAETNANYDDFEDSVHDDEQEEDGENDIPGVQVPPGKPEAPATSSSKNASSPSDDTQTLKATIKLGLPDAEHEGGKDAPEASPSPDGQGPKKAQDPKEKETKVDPPVPTEQKAKP
ncbi:MAG: hypothetical protein KDI65_06025 [Alphaproteobacteria bacterium]|nr:hypothetical protein [Alphaproteobacteria bacterium]